MKCFNHKLVCRNNPRYFGALHSLSVFMKMKMWPHEAQSNDIQQYKTRNITNYHHPQCCILFTMLSFVASNVLAFVTDKSYHMFTQVLDHFVNLSVLPSGLQKIVGKTS
jgi:hypothetical protein